MQECHCGCHHHNEGGIRVVITRAESQSSDFVDLLLQNGAVPVLVPAIRVEPHPNHDDIVDALMGLNGYDWIIFTSVNGVHTFFNLFFRRFKDIRDFGGARIAVVGSATAAAVEKMHLQVDVIPEKFTAKALAKAIDAFDALENRRILIVRPEVGNPDLPQMLEYEGAIVDDIPFYRTLPETPERLENRQLRECGADWMTFCSPSAVRAFHNHYDLPTLIRQFPGMKIASIGPETSKAIQALGVEPTVQANPYTVDAMVEAILSA